VFIALLIFAAKYRWS